MENYIFDSYQYFVILGWVLSHRSTELGFNILCDFFIKFGVTFQSRRFYSKL